MVAFSIGHRKLSAGCKVYSIHNIIPMGLIPLDRPP